MFTRILGGLTRRTDDQNPAQLGFTQFWPGSHRGEGLAGFGDASLVLDAALDGMLKAGDCVIYDYR